MKILIASTPAPGHLNPLLAIARMALARGDEAVVMTGAYLAPVVAMAGARFLPLEAHLDPAAFLALWTRRNALPPGPEQQRFDFERFFLDAMPTQAEALRAAIAAERPDAVVVDDYFFGATALFLDPKPRPPIVACGISVLLADRPDGAPALLGLAPAADDATRARYRAIAAEVEAAFAGPVRAHADAKLAAMGLPPLPCPVLHSRHLMADAYLMSTVPAFEFDRGALPAHVRFVGPLPPPPAPVELRPDWWDDLDGGRPAVLVTQGTVNNTDFGELVEPTLAALADRDDLLVVVTTGGRPAEAVGGPIPGDARLAVFLDYGALLPRLSALVTNGGYGTVQLALRAGVPIVAAGRSEDKAEVGARVSWSGVGVEIPKQRPGADELRDAVGRVLTDPSYRGRARAIAADMAAVDTRTEVLGVLDRLVAERPGRC